MATWRVSSNLFGPFVVFDDTHEKNLLRHREEETLP